MMRKLFPLSLWAILWALIAVAHAEGAVKAHCAECHDQGKEIAGTAHGTLSCTVCHRKHGTFPHPPGIPKPSCTRCHADVVGRYRLSVHGLARAKGNGDAPDCGDCHGDVHGVKRTGTEAFRKSIPGVCGTCHDKVLAEYRESVHGKAVAEGIVAAPVCSSCHGEHMILGPSKGASPVSPSHIPETCGRCHGDVRLTERFGLPQMTIASYEKSVHGLALKAGSETVANCASCHGVHRILPSSDPRSTIYPENLAKTCGKCHPGAGTRFAIGHIHWGEGAPPPASVRWVRTAYLVLIPLTIGLMFLHNLGDWVRKLVALRFVSGGPADVPEPAEDTLGAPAFFRMYRMERIQHALLMLSFTVLVWTGFALVYPDQWWARPLVAWEGNWPVRGTIHRIAGAILILTSVFHVVSLLASDRLRRHWLTLKPSSSDVLEASGTFAYLIGLRRHRPKISFHSYMEKLEYWAVVWGTLVMAATGIMLWANTFILAWLPKVALDVAVAVHFYEAVLATLAIVVWHFYMVLFDPMVYPMDPAWITGYSVRKRDGEEKAGEFAEGLSEGPKPKRGNQENGGGKPAPPGPSN
jgi:cytochrome b subunit of formate dehydrogenase